MDLHHPDLEGLCIDVMLPKTKPFLCGVVYRTLNQTYFYDVFESIIFSSDSINSSETYIFGDFNTDVYSKKNVIFVAN